MKALYFIANSGNIAVTEPYESKENLLSEHSLDEGETLVEVAEGDDGYDELLKCI